MHITISLSSLVYVIAIAGGFFTLIVCWYSVANRFLEISILSIVCILANAFLVENHLVPPNLYAVSNLFWLIYIPCFFLYVKRTISPHQLSSFKLVHSIPAILFLLIFAYSLIHSHEGKVPDRLYNAFTVSVLIFYSGLQLRIFTRLFENHATSDLKIWLSICQGIQLLLAINFLIHVLTNTENTTLYLNLSIAAIFMTAYLLLHPRILYAPLLSKIPRSTESGENLINTQTGGYSLTQEVTPPGQQPNERIGIELSAFMASNAPYLQVGYSLHDLSRDTHIPAYQLSDYLNRGLGLSFSDYLNQHRIQHCVQRMQQGDGKHLTLEALSYECGFNNRNTFTSAFRKATGLTPSEYLRTQKRD